MEAEDPALTLQDGTISMVLITTVSGTLRTIDAENTEIVMRTSVRLPTKLVVLVAEEARVVLLLLVHLLVHLHPLLPLAAYQQSLSIRV